MALENQNRKDGQLVLLVRVDVAEMMMHPHLHHGREEDE